MIIIPEMDGLPNNCHECPWSFLDDEYCEYWCPWCHCLVDSYGGEKCRMEDCPLAESEK